MKNTNDMDHKVSNQYRADFNGLLVDSVEETITEILGAKVARILWRYWETYLDITRENMPSNLQKLFESMQTIFGRGGETVGERVIRKLYAKADVSLRYSDNRPLTGYAEELRQSLLVNDQGTP
jgi:hypothetical protein